MIRSLFRFLFVPGLVVSLAADVLMLDFGPTRLSGDALTNSPYHTVNTAFSGTVWNTVDKIDVPAGQLRFADGRPASAIALDLGATRDAGITRIDLSLKPEGYHALSGATFVGVYEATSAGGDAIYHGNKFDRSRAVGLQVLGLAPGDYDVYVVARNTNTPADQTQILSVGAASPGAFDFTSSAYTRRRLTYRHAADATDLWVEDTNYLRFNVTLAAGQVLNIASIGGENAERRGFLNCVQIVRLAPAPSHLVVR